MREGATKRGLPTVRLWFLELGLADRAALRAQKFCTMPPSGEPEKMMIETNDNDSHRTKLAPQKIQRLLFLYEAENLSVAALAARMRVSKSTVRRILKGRQRLVPSPPHVRHGVKWREP